MKRVLTALALAALFLPGTAAAGLFDRTVELEQSDFATKEWTLAQRYHFLDDYAELLADGPVTVERRCEVQFWQLQPDKESTARLGNCTSSDANGEEIYQFSQMGRMIDSFAAREGLELPPTLWTAQELESGDKVRFALTIDPARLAVDFNIESGRMVGPEEVLYGSERLRLDFPPRALRLGVGGMLKVHCQIQRDYSLICIPLAFEIPEHFDLFAEHFLRQSRNLTMRDVLKDGSPSAGVHFKLDVNYKLSDF